jgi:diguanylate cyclase (GGDEF)-like protein
MASADPIPGGMTAAAPRAPYAFTDPLGAASGDVPRLGPKEVLRRATIGGYLAGGATVLTALALPDSDPSDHLELAVIGALLLAIALALALWRTPPDAVALALPLVATLIISALVAACRPMALVPIFYVWPLVLTAYSCQRREVLLNYLAVLVGFAIALAGWAPPDTRIVMWVLVAVVGGVLATLVTALKERLSLVVGDLRSLATHDPLTGVLNRRAFAAALEDALLRAARDDVPSAVLVLDVDWFKAINDTWGHATGDRTLKDLSATLQRCTRASDEVGRLGGEEFGILLHATDAAGAEVYAERLRLAVAGSSGQDAPAITVSIGVAAMKPDQDVDHVLDAADYAMYAAKDAGRDRVVVAAA